MSENIVNAPHGMNLVVETENGTIYIGRFDQSNGFEVVMHDVDLLTPTGDQDAEHWIRETATYGVDVKHRDLSFPAAGVTRWRALGDIEKLA